MSLIRPEVRSAPSGAVKVAMVSSYPPDRCGIGRFSWSLVTALQQRGNLTVDVVRLVGQGEPKSRPAPEVVMEIDPRSAIAVAAAARRLEQADVAIVQHEFGLYGDHDGAAVVDLVAAVRRPCIVVLHTVLPEPSPGQRAVIDALDGSAAGFVALSRSARDLLVSGYGIDPHRIAVIPHGSAWSPLPARPAPRRTLLTWGLLGPGKGIERAIDAIARVAVPTPDIAYRVVGQIHPSVLRRDGPVYREELQRRAARAGLGSRIEFDDRYQDEAGLLRAVSAADVVVLPYDNHEQICSGVLTEAVSAGKPVVATAFPHAVELLGGGAGIVVDHDDRAAMTSAVETLLTDDLAYRRAADAAAAVGARLGWAAVAERYRALLTKWVDRRVTV